MENKFPRVKINQLIRLMSLFASTDSVKKDRLAKAMRYINFTGVSNHVKTGIILGLLEQNDDSIDVISQGKKFTKGLEHQIKLVSEFLTDNNEGLGVVTDCLKNEGVQFGFSDLQKCVQLHVDTATQAKKYADILVDWYQFASMLSRNGDRINSTLSLMDFQLGQSFLFSNTALDFKLYMDLTAAEFDSASSLHHLTFDSIEKTYQTFMGAAPQDSEPYMLDFVSRVFQILGFSAIFSRGSRKYGNLDFGSNGDDLLVVLPYTGRTIDPSINGVALACELKRRIGSKTAVAQAVTFANQVLAEFPKLQVFPIVITGSDCYHDEIAQTYALSSQVMHIPLEFLFELAKLQLEKYRKGKMLVTALDFMMLYIRLRSAQQIEPRAPDLLDSLKL